MNNQCKSCVYKDTRTCEERRKYNGKTYGSSQNTEGKCSEYMSKTGEDWRIDD